MNVLIDTNILTRSAEPGHPMHGPAATAVTTLRTRGDTPCVVPQVLYEFWVVCTRPTSANGLGRTPTATATELQAIQALFRLLLDPPGLFAEWERLVASLGVAGKNAHDARLVAAMAVHGVTHLLTFNDADFRRFPGITVLTPAAVIASTGS